MDTVRNINEALDFFLNNHSDSVKCVMNNKEFIAKSFNEAKSFFERNK